MAKVSTGAAHTGIDKPTHVKGIIQGNALGNYAKMAGHRAGRHLHGGALDGRREHRTDRPEHAKPLPGLGLQWRPSHSPSGAAAGAVPQLSFAVADAAAERYSAAPTLELRAGIERVRRRRRALDPARHPDPDRGATAALRRGRAGVAGRAVRHARSLEHDAAHAAVDAHDARRAAVHATPPRSTLPVACSYDLEVNAASYLSALQDGEVPLEFLFSGSVFYAGPGGMLQTARISWDREAEYRLPRGVVARGDGPPLPGRGLAAAGAPAFDRLRAYKAEHGLRTLEDAVERLMGGG